MTTFEVLFAIYMALLPPALGTLFWTRLSRIETMLAQVVTRDEFNSATAVSRQEMASFRSDLTQVALAVGARPRASEG